MQQAPSWVTTAAQAGTRPLHRSKLSPPCADKAPCQPPWGLRICTCMQQLPPSEAMLLAGAAAPSSAHTRPRLVRMDAHNDAAVQEDCQRQLRVSDVRRPHFRGIAHSLLCHVCG